MSATATRRPLRPGDRVHAFDLFGVAVTGTVAGPFVYRDRVDDLPRPPMVFVRETPGGPDILVRVRDCRLAGETTTACRR